MASSQVLGEMVVKIQADIENLKKGLANAQLLTKKASTESVKSLDTWKTGFSQLGLGAGIGLAAVVVGLKSCVTAASNAAETTQKFNVVFRDISEQANKSAIDFANSFNVSKQASQDMLSQTGQVLQSVGFMQDASLQMSVQVNQLASDLVSFTNYSGGAKQASDILTKALLGEREALGALGLKIPESELKRFIEAQGKSYEKATLQEKAAATLTMLYKMNANALGDVARSQGTFAYNARAMENSINNIKVAIGKGMIGELSTLGGIFISISPALEVVAEKLTAVSVRLIKIALIIPEVLSQFGELKKTISLYSEGKISTKELILGYERPAAAGATTKPKTASVSAGISAPLSNDDAKKIADERLKIQQDYAQKAFAIENDKSSQMALQEQNLLNQFKDDEATKTDIQRAFAAERKQIASEEFQSNLQMASNSVGQLSSLFSQYAENQNLQLDKDKQKKLDSINSEYEAQVVAINNSVDTQENKNKKLKALDEKKARDEKAIEEKIAKQKRKVAYDLAVQQKATSIVQAIIGTAVGISQAWSMGPIAGIIFSAIIAAMGAAQVALIASQPLPALADGGVFTGAAIIGEAGKEMALPLEGEAGKNAFALMADAVMDNINTRVNTSATAESVPEKKQTSLSQPMYIDGKYFGEWITEQTDNGNIRVNQRSVK